MAKAPVLDAHRPTGMLSIRRTLPICAATSKRAGWSPSESSRAAAIGLAQFGIVDTGEAGLDQRGLEAIERGGNRLAAFDRGDCLAQAIRN